jgi:molybdenum cofactor synthesis domain-containing protein
MDGIVSGISGALEDAEKIGLTVDFCADEGDEVFSGDLIMQICGSPKQICMAEDMLIGRISKFSGVATAARNFAKTAGKDMRVVCGAWKKIPAAIKGNLRTAVETGGVHLRITDDPMVYLDKNYVAMFGGIQTSLAAAARFRDRKKAIQVRGRFEGGDIINEAWTAITAGADIVYVDTGKIEELKRVTEAIKPMLGRLEAEEGYRKVEFAFGGGAKIEELCALKDAGADIVDVGRGIVDAALLDLRLEVTKVTDPEDSHAGYSLLDKGELEIEGIVLEQSNLNELAAAVAEEIGIDAKDVLVIDVRDSTVTLDILRSRLDPAQFVSKEESILNRLRNLRGVILDANARISSNGMLGWIAGDNADMKLSRDAVSLSKRLGEQLARNISGRVIVFPTGIEIEKGEIEDTNTPLIMEKLTEAGFAADKGEILKDDVNLLYAKLLQAAERGYGVSITTGGVGAENKDYSVEAVMMIDSRACTPYIAKFKTGIGRHSKDGIRIAVGKAGLTTYIALPGPNDEVAVCIDTVVKGITENWSREVLAGELARLLRTRLKEKIEVTRHYHGHA